MGECVLASGAAFAREFLDRQKITAPELGGFDRSKEI
jgi:hypothetical protein